MVKQQGVLLVLTPSSKNQKNFILCKSGEEANLPMYCLRRCGVSLDRFNGFSWRNIMVFSNEEEFDECVKEIRKDLQWFYGTGV